jgi:hypothetical protein
MHISHAFEAHHKNASRLDACLRRAEAFRMPTNLPPPRRQEDPRTGPNLAAIAVALALFVGGLWLFYALSDANDKLNCVVSGRTNCDQIRP